VIVLLIVVVLLRPLFRNLSNAGDSINTHKRLAQEAQRSAAAEGGLTGHMDGNRKLESVRNLVAEQPETVARVVKQWTLANE
jgi:flagellar biosynthesis/type III secretory pathway M-ring protein FliF/YscJ